MSQNQDILVELNNNELQELAQMYCPYKRKFHMIYSFLQTSLRSKSIHGMENFVQIYSPNGSWRYDGTFIASMPSYGHDIVAHSLDSSGRNLTDGLKFTKRFKFGANASRDYTLFYAIHEQFSSKIAEVFAETANYKIESTKVGMWTLDEEEALSFSSKDWEVPTAYIEEMVPSEITLINSVWPHRYRHSEDKHLDWLKVGLGYGVHLRPTGNLVAWVKTSCLGQLCALQTLEKYKRRGFAAALIKRISYELAKNGFDPCALVITENTASKSLMEKLGFKNQYNCVFIEVYNKK
ncbi:uncharacterized protein [Euwallacea fornicatus]|uniref:uncharacterized protein n=1 Tax=Euwallacea fornicatus TaxID=995702 RepID=UPI00338E26CD